MINRKQIVLILTILIFFIFGIFLGKLAESMKYKVALAGCRKSQLPNESYKIINIDSSPVKQMFKNYYSKDLNFIELYASEKYDYKNIVETFGYGGFHFFKTDAGEIYQCGFYK